jgi:hypothetical protein
MAIALRAARFSLDRIREVLPPSILEPKSTMVDAEMDLAYDGTQLSFKGKLDVSGLNLEHEAVASEQVRGLNLSLALDGKLDPVRRRLELAKFEGRSRSLVGRLQGMVELVPGKFRFTDGTEMPMIPKIEIRVQVPKIPCAKLLESIPGPIVPHLQGFEMKGTFEADVFTKIDYANLEDLILGGKVGIEGCQVLKAPEEVTALAGPGSLTQMVEIPAADKNAAPGTTELLAFAIGTREPGLRPLRSDLAVPHQLAVDHRGQRLLQAPGLGHARVQDGAPAQPGRGRVPAGGLVHHHADGEERAAVAGKTSRASCRSCSWSGTSRRSCPRSASWSCITTPSSSGRASTASVRRQALLRQAPLADHAAGGAFFSSIMPSPKRPLHPVLPRAALPALDKYVRRILLRVHERGRLTPEEYAQAAATPFQFDITARGMSETECHAWIKKDHGADPEPPPAADVVEN